MFYVCGAAVAEPQARQLLALLAHDPDPAAAEAIEAILAGLHGRKLLIGLSPAQKTVIVTALRLKPDLLPELRHVVERQQIHRTPQRWTIDDLGVNEVVSRRRGGNQEEP